MQYLLAKLQKHGYIKFHRDDENEIVKDLFWSQPTSSDMLCAFLQVLMMDCTYNTNRVDFLGRLCIHGKGERGQLHVGVEKFEGYERPQCTSRGYRDRHGVSLNECH
ncbi:hypothetical protein RHMOL_Rhmol04G0127800 [Rhododendron molle]|nr:hypothetical protein RHMOL_Rhmol04G0127800 [Rhododendron molle]